MQTRDISKRFGDFIKLTEVKDIIEEIINPVLHDMKVREEEYTSIKNQVNFTWLQLKKNTLKNQKAN